jgi:hypothetical protein
VTYYLLFFIHLESRRVSLAGITRHPDQAWMQQMARNASGEDWGFLELQYALHDRDTKFYSVFRDTLAAGGTKPVTHQTDLARDGGAVVANPTIKPLDRQ